MIKYLLSFLAAVSPENRGPPPLPPANMSTEAPTNQDFCGAKWQGFDEFRTSVTSSSEYLQLGTGNIVNPTNLYTAYIKDMRWVTFIEKGHPAYPSVICRTFSPLPNNKVMIRLNIICSASIEVCRDLLADQNQIDSVLTGSRTPDPNGAVNP